MFRNIILSLLLLAALGARGQTEVDSLARVLNERYIFPEVAKKMGAFLYQQQKAGVYAKLSGDALAAAMTHDIREVSHDLHLRVSYFKEPQPVTPEHDLMKTPEAEKPGLQQFLKFSNYGISKVDVLDGNIGYIDFKGFCTPEFAGDTYAAVMRYLAHTDALIIDLRKCTGSGSPDAIPFFASYFFAEPVHLVDWHWRKNGEVKQAWSYAYVPGARYLNKPVYILTSRATFSGAEEFAYDMQNLKRATLIGQRTGGGANPGGDVRVDAHFSVFVPVGQAISPVTGTNWEGAGVQPDTAMHPALALFKAKELALQEGLKNATDENWKNALTHWLADTKASQPVLRPVTFELAGFPDAKEVFVAGTFNDWSDKADQLSRSGNKWVITTQSERGQIAYKFIVDGNWITDPANPKQTGSGKFTDSIKTIE